MRRHPLDALWDQLVKEYMATEPKPKPKRSVMFDRMASSGGCTA
jgi:hypothetical protein